MDAHLLHELQHISQSMFHKNYFGVFHGSISAKISINSFVINKRAAILDEMSEEDFIDLSCDAEKDYRWKEASVDVDIHKSIYSNLLNAKYISYTMPPYSTAYSLNHDIVIPKDYYGSTLLDPVHIYDPKGFNDWEERAAQEITQCLKNSDSNLLLIKGFGLISYDRDLTDMVKKVAILENSCRLLTINSVN